MNAKLQLAKTLGTLEAFPVPRRDYWTRRLRMQAHRIAVLRGTVVVSGESEWTLELANFLDAINASNPLSGGYAGREPLLVVANEVDKIYRAVADEAKSVARTAAEAAKAAGFALMPVAAVVLAVGAALYLGRASAER